MPAHSAPPHLFFLTQPKGNGAILFSMRGTLRGPELSKIGTFEDHDESQLLAATLNAALQGGAGALAKVHGCSASLPGPLRKAITDIADEIEDTHRDAPRARAARRAARAVTENLGQLNAAVFSLFSASHCGSCLSCGCNVAEDCAKCAVCGSSPRGRGCGDCGGVGVTPRTAFVLHRQLRDLADKTYRAAYDPDFWEHSVPVSAGTQSDWFLLHCARAYDDLAADLLAGGIPEPRCLAESVLFGYAVDGIGGFSIESVHADEVYQTLPTSRFDYDWEFLANESGLLDVSDRAHDFLEADVAEEDLWDEWFKPYTDVEARDTNRGFCC
ncbi:hypothetical protein EDD90_1787 [Streptomyces sp. Ag109_O5-1]|uniref:hypothetical protein n=1 Tax=Streptomyces sp. Ag109_O5-1 TaxID=1938851 RepID=UPI000F504604|nr:hypothetical protein [Streptomyces sp. Ag109_O5-1]RPE38854.1 hypothetical protein EDD90_1787 [Streptomyces sp. Ag109_O5-1]